MLLKFQGFATSGANTTVVENGISCGECCVCVFKHQKSKSMLAVQNRFHVELGRELPTKMSFYRCYNLFSGAGHISKRKTHGKQPSSEVKLHKV